MKSGVPPKPTGDGPKWFYFRRVWELLWGGLFPIKGTKGCIVTWENGIYYVSADPAIARAGEQGWHFHKPLVYASATQYAKNDVVFVGDENTAVTAGVLQPDDTQEYATPGFWVCFKPPRVTVGDATTIHLPSFTIPAETDAEDLYWWPIWTNICG